MASVLQKAGVEDLEDHWAEEAFMNGSRWVMRWMAAAALIAVATGCQGPAGKAGESGQPGSDGASGFSCWDQNQNGSCDADTEDTNGDGVCSVADCAGAPGKDGTPGEPGAPGHDGTPGKDGVACWDLNGNGVCDPGSEDRNGDMQCNVLDCQGKDGEPGQIVVPEVPPELGDTNLIAFHADITDQTPDSLCRTCHGTMRNLQSLDPAIKKFHSRKFEILGDQPCTFCHGAVDLLNRSGATVRKQVDVKAKCLPCHVNNPKFYMGE